MQKSIRLLSKIAIVGLPWTLFRRSGAALALLVAGAVLLLFSGCATTGGAAGTDSGGTADAGNAAERDGAAEPAFGAAPGRAGKSSSASGEGADDERLAEAEEEKRGGDSAGAEAEAGKASTDREDAEAENTPEATSTEDPDAKAETEAAAAGAAEAVNGSEAVEDSDAGQADRRKDAEAVAAVSGSEEAEPERGEAGEGTGADAQDPVDEGRSDAEEQTQGGAERSRQLQGEAFRRLSASQAYIRHRELHISALLHEMSLEAKLGQMLMPALSYGPQGNPATRVHERAAAMLRELQPGGVILFGPNISGIDQTLRLTEELQRSSAMPLFIAVDEEGGTVSRLGTSQEMGATETPAASVIGAIRDRELAFRIGAIIGRELRSLGINMNFAPVADVLTNPGNSVIGQRAFGADPQLVAEMVAETVRGLQSEQVASVIKHFPGHGDTVTDSHTETVTVEHGIDRLLRVELVPFEAGIDAGADGIMTGHIAVPRVTGTDRPATISPELLGGLLRGQLGFEGLVVSDAMSMQAVSGRFEAGALAVEAVKAGVDIVLKPEDPYAARSALLRAVREGTIEQERIDDSVKRILRVKLDRRVMSLPEFLEVRPELETPGPASRVLGAPAHRGVVEELFSRYNATQ